MTLKTQGKYLKVQLEEARKTIEIEKINFKGKKFTDRKQITELCNEHFVSIGDKLAKSIQSPTAQIQPATVKFRFKPIQFYKSRK